MQSFYARTIQTTVQQSSVSICSGSSQVIHLLGDFPFAVRLTTLFGMIPQTVADFAERARQLEALARPTPEDTPFFNHCMGLAKSMGMTWEQALQYVVECRNGIKK